MSYSTDNIYKLVGRDDKVAVLTFITDSDAYQKYGETLTALFLYDQFEREKFEKRFLEQIDEGKSGDIKVRYLGLDLAKAEIDTLKKSGINSEDILSIFPSHLPHHNLFHSEEKRAINTLEIPIHKESKGGDYDWMYGFNRKMVSEGMLMFPYERESYLAMKLHYEPESFTDDEKAYAYSDGKLKKSIERHYLDLRFEKEIITLEEEKRWEELTSEFMEENMKLLKKDLQSVGSSMAALYVQNKGLYNHLLTGTLKYLPERLNGLQDKPIYLDWQGYLHVFIRHVEEFTINNAFPDKDKFLWHPKDVITVIKHVIESVDEEIQLFWKDKPDQRFSKYGAQSLYFEGDYYTFHVEADGRLSTLHRTKKRI